MAGTISQQITQKMVNGALNDPGPNLGSISVNQATALLWKDVLTLVAGTDTNISVLINNITTYGIAYFYNMDATNYVDWGADNGSGVIAPVGRMLPADIPHSFRLTPGITLRMKAHTGNCNVIVCVYNN